MVRGHNIARILILQNPRLDVARASRLRWCLVARWNGGLLHFEALANMRLLDLTLDKLMVLRLLARGGSLRVVRLAH